MATSTAALASLKALECGAQATGFVNEETVAGVLATDDLRALSLPLA